MIVLILSLIVGLPVAASTCTKDLAVKVWIEEILDPARDPRAVRAALEGFLSTPSSEDRALVRRVAQRCCVGGLDPEVAWPIDDRWMLYRAPPAPPRLFTMNCEHEVEHPKLAAELDRRVVDSQLTTVTSTAIVTEAPVNRLGSSCRVRRRVRVDGREHQTAALSELGYRDAPAEIRDLLGRLAVTETLNPDRNRRTLTVPRFHTWPKRLRALGRAFSEIRLREISLNSEPVPAPADVNAAELKDAYLRSLSFGQVPLILDRWDLDEPLRHAVGALAIPPKHLRWFQSVAARALELTAYADGSRARAFETVGGLVMRQFTGLLEVGTALMEGRLDDAEVFIAFAEFAWPALSLPDQMTAAALFEYTPAFVATLLGKHRLPGIDDPQPLSMDQRSRLIHIHRAMLNRRDELMRR